MRGKDYNTIFGDLQMAGISCYQNFLRAVIDSNYAKEFNPYTDYLYALPPWDGTDYIARLADTLTTENRELWQKGFKRWIVGLVACALSDEDKMCIRDRPNTFRSFILKYSSSRVIPYSSASTNMGN